MKRTIIFLLTLIVLVFIGFFIREIVSYTINNDTREIKAAIENWVSRGSKSTKEEITIIAMKDIDNVKLIYFINSKSNQGEAVLNSGINKKYKIDHTGQGTDVFRYATLITNKGKYFWIMGKNSENRIHKVKAKYKLESYEIIIPKQEYFIEYHKISDEIKEYFPYEIEFLDDKDINIFTQMKMY